MNINSIIQMRISKSTLLAFLFFGANVQALFACNCEPVVQLSAADWNDADVIFTATLTGHKIGRVGMLKFDTQKAYKGEVDANITFYFQLGINHTLLHAIKEFKEGDEWIVFARKFVAGEKTQYRLKDSPVRTMCALSRPLQEDRAEDPYLLFLKDMAQKAEGHRKMYDENGQLTAEGEYAGQIPVNRWAYYDIERKTKVEGDYVNGQREGAWLQTKPSSNGEQQAIRKTIYKNGIPAEIHDYSHTGQVSLKKILTDSTETRYYYRYDGTLKSKIVEDLDNNTTHILNYSESEALLEERFMEEKRVVRQYWYDEDGKLAREWVIGDGD